MSHSDKQAQRMKTEILARLRADDDRPREVLAGFVTASDLERRRVEWLLDQRVPMAEVVAIAADGGAGKSTLAQDLGARTTRGDLSGIPGGRVLDRPRGLVLVTAEEDPEAVVRPRLEAMGADLERVLVLSDAAEGDAPFLTLPSGADRLADAASHVDAGMIIVDTGPGFLDRGLRPIAEEDVRAFYRPLARIAREQRLVVLVVVHLNKGNGSARQRVAGNAAWVNVPRSVLLLAPPPGDDPTETPVRFLAVVKANLIAGRMPPVISLSLVSAPEDETVAAFEWGGEAPGVRASELTSQMGADEHGERSDCCDAIADLLADGPKPASECEKTLTGAGHSKATIRRARQALFISRPAGTVFREGYGGPWMWRLPVGAHPSLAPSVSTYDDPRAPTGGDTESRRCSPTPVDAHQDTQGKASTYGGHDWRDLLPEGGGE